MITRDAGRRTPETPKRRLFFGAVRCVRYSRVVLSLAARSQLCSTQPPTRM